MPINQHTPQRPISEELFIEIATSFRDAAFFRQSAAALSGRVAFRERRVSCIGQFKIAGMGKG